MNELFREVLALIDQERLQNTLYELVEISSPTGDTREFAEHYANRLQETGLTGVELVETAGWENSPSVTGWRRGDSSGPTLQFSGHQDHIHQPHVAPYIDGGRVYGRGSSDMKSGLAAMLELARVLATAGVQLPGDLLFTTHDLHEAPVGYGEGLRTLLDAGYVGDAVIVAEGPNDEFYIAGKSHSVYEIVLRWPEEAIHELSMTPDMPNLVELSADAVQALKALKKDIGQRQDEVLGPETLFLGSLEAGDFYNRLPQSCRIVGTRRYPPETNWRDVEKELHNAVAQALAGQPVEISADASKRNHGFRISPDEPIAQALRKAYRTVTGQAMPISIQLFAADNGKFIQWANVPAVAHGVGLGRAHADLEWCPVDNLVRLTKVLTLSTLEFYGLA
jgi:acetylornithine deacetylase/succinyl-diaminopimelate desuccinylase-like protein